MVATNGRFFKILDVIWSFQFLVIFSITSVERVARISLHLFEFV